MKFLRAVLFTGMVLSYGGLFAWQEQMALDRNVSLDLAMPEKFYKISAGYLSQLAAEMLFIRSSVFLGGVKAGTPPEGYARPLANNYEVMTKLYPRFIDPYYFCQSYLTHISSELASRANAVLETGIAAYPEDINLRFFHGANFFLFMNEPLKGAQAFTEAAKLPNAPPMFAHLAALLSAQGGNIAAGLISLRAMQAAEKDEEGRARYQREIVIFEQALEVQNALQGYIRKYSGAPERLERLVPEFIAKVPVLEGSFVMVYNPPNLILKRPDRQKRKDSGIPWR